MWTRGKKMSDWRTGCKNQFAVLEHFRNMGNKKALQIADKYTDEFYSRYTVDRAIEIVEELANV